MSHFESVLDNTLFSTGELPKVLWLPNNYFILSVLHGGLTLTAVKLSVGFHVILFLTCWLNLKI